MRAVTTLSVAATDGRRTDGAVRRPMEVLAAMPVLAAGAPLGRLRTVNGRIVGELAREVVLALAFTLVLSAGAEQRVQQGRVAALAGTEQAVGHLFPLSGNKTSGFVLDTACSGMIHKCRSRTNLNYDFINVKVIS